MKTVFQSFLICIMLSCLCVPTKAQSLESRLNKIIIKEIACEEAQAKDVFELVRQKSKEADPEGKGVNFVFQDMPEGRAVVTINLADVPLIKVVEYICIASKLKYRIDTHAIIISKDTRDPKKPAK